MKRATVTLEKVVVYRPMLLAAGFELAVLEAIPDIYKPCDPDWLFLQITMDDLMQTGWH